MRRLLLTLGVIAIATSCRSGQTEDHRIVVTFSGSALGAEGELLPTRKDQPAPDLRNFDRPR